LPQRPYNQPMKKEKIYTILFFTIVFILSLSLPSLAGMVSENYCLSSSVLSGGGNYMSSANYQINSTLGQPSPLPDSDNPPTSANYRLFPGVWYTIGYTLSEQIREVGVGYAYTTIQEAVNEANYGDVILVHDGMYNENISFQGKGILIYSENGPDSTIINGNAAGPVVTFENEGRDSVLMGFKIKNGHAESGGGILCLNSSPIIANCVIIENEASLTGGGIYGSNAFPLMINCLLQGNTKNGLPNQICLIDESVAYNDTQIVSCNDDNRVYIQKFNQTAGRWGSNYRFFGKQCGINTPLQENDILFISYFP